MPRGRKRLVDDDGRRILRCWTAACDIVSRMSQWRGRIARPDILDVAKKLRDMLAEEFGSNGSEVATRAIDKRRIKPPIASESGVPVENTAESQGNE